MRPESIDYETVDEPLPDYVTEAYESMYRSRTPGAMKFKDTLEGTLYKEGGRYYLPVGRHVMKHQDEWAYIPEDEVDTREVAEHAYQIAEDILPFTVSFYDEGDMYTIFAHVPIRPDDDHAALGKAVLAVLSTDSIQQFENQFASDVDSTYISHSAYWSEE